MDGGPLFNGEAFKEFCRKWQIKHRKSSAGYPEWNRRAELAVKPLKKLIEKNMSSDESLNTDAMVRAKFQFKNTPIRGCSNLIWSAFDGQFTNGPEGRLEDSRELGMAKLKVDRKETYDKGKHNLEPLKNGDKVIIQIMTGPHPTRWMRKGTMIKNS